MRQGPFQRSKAVHEDKRAPGSTDDVRNAGKKESVVAEHALHRGQGGILTKSGEQRRGDRDMILTQAGAPSRLQFLHCRGYCVYHISRHLMT